MSSPPEGKRISIPSALVAAGFRFLKVRAREKSAVEKDWQTTKNYEGADPEIQEWVARGGNYGVLAGNGRILIDLDNPDLFPLLDKLPPTYVVQSGSGTGRHAYYVCPGAKNLKFDNPLNSKENWGHCQADRKYVVGPNCIHPSGGIYLTIQDLPIATITFDDLKTVFSEYILEKKPVRAADIRKAYGPHARAFDDIPIDRVAFPLNAHRRSQHQIYGEHPVHGSTTGMNFHLDTQKNVWYCFRCQSGGGPLEWLAVQHGIINCADAGAGCLRGDEFLRVLEIARGMGFDVDVPRRQITPKPKIVDTEPTSLDRLPDRLPDEPVVLVRAPPRIGKTHWAVTQAIKAGSANLITNHHSILEQQLRIFQENKEPYHCAVHLCGKERSCRHRDDPEGMPECNGDECSFYPFLDRNSWLELNTRAASLFDVMEHKDRNDKTVADRIMDVEGIENPDKKDIFQDTCPYFMLRAAERSATHVFTVVNLIDALSQRPLNILDEDTSVPHFFPQSVGLLERSMRPGSRFVVNHLEQHWPAIEKFKAKVTKGRKLGRKTVLRAIEILEQIRPVLQEPDDAPRKTEAQILEALSEIDCTIEPPADIPPLELLDALRHEGMDSTFTPYLEALLYPFLPCRFAWTPGSTRTLCMIADEGTRFREIPPGKLLIIGATRAELLIKSLNAPHAVISIDSFPMSNHFAFIVPTPDAASKVKNMRRRKTFSPKQEIIGILKSLGSSTENMRRHPVLVLSGSSRDQAYLKEHLGGIFHQASDEGQIGHLWNLAWGGLTGFYQNSNISRGVDVPIHQMLVVYSTGFANPYWSARHEVALAERKHDEALFTAGIMDAILMDETTNSVLRIAPIPDLSSKKWGDGWVRAIVLTERDFDLIAPSAIKNSAVIRQEISRFDAPSIQQSEFFQSLSINPHFKKPGENRGVLVRLREPNSKTIEGGSVPDLEEFKALFKQSGIAGCSVFPKTFKRTDQESLEKAVIEHMLWQNKNGYRVSRIALVKWASKRKKAFTPDNVLRMVENLLVRGILYVDGGVGDQAMISIRMGRIMENGEILAVPEERPERSLPEYWMGSEVPPTTSPDIAPVQADPWEP